MNKDKKKQMFAIFVMIMFVGSGLAYAVISIVPTSEDTKQLWFIRPLEDIEEAPYLQDNFVVVKYFFVEDGERNSYAEERLNKIFQELGGKLIIEFIDAELYDYEADRLGIEEYPYLYLKGSTIEKTNDFDNLKGSICSLYFEEIDECSIM